MNNSTSNVSNFTNLDLFESSESNDHSYKIHAILIYTSGDIYVWSSLQTSEPYDVA